MDYQFANAVKAAIIRHGIISTYKREVAGVFDVNTSSATPTEYTYNFKIYMKHIQANQYNFPNLIGKDAGIFYIDASLVDFIPKAQDLITYNTKTYQVSSVQSFAAQGSIIMYKLIGVA